jgi:hypothetical protein
MSNLPRELYRTKMTVLGLIFSISGVALIVLGNWLTHSNLHAWTWLHDIPFSELGATLFGIGVVSTAYDYYTAKDEAENAIHRLRQTLKQEAPVMRDAVIEGFAFEPEDLARVSTPETLDKIIENSLAIRLGDHRFASELYADIRDQAVRSVERWHDAKINIRLSATDSRSTHAGGAPSSTRRSDAQRLTITVRQEYTAVPATQTRRFASVSDPEDYRELTEDGSATFVWFTKPTAGVDASSIEAFELVQFSVDGDERPIRRSPRSSGQIYTVSLGIPEADRGKPVTIAFTYQLTRPAVHNRWLHVDVEQPTRGIDVTLDYSDTDITEVSMLDFIASSQQAIVTKTPPKVPGKTVGLEFDGWLMPKSGVAFVWTTQAEISHAKKATEPAKR